MSSRLMKLLICILSLQCASPAFADIQKDDPVKKAECLAKGEDYKWEPGGMMQIYQCVFYFRDGGKPCTDSKECKGGCEADNWNTPNRDNGQPVHGHCAKTNSMFGCHATLVGGKIRGGICAD